MMITVTVAVLLQTSNMIEHSENVGPCFQAEGVQSELTL